MVGQVSSVGPQRIRVGGNVQAAMVISAPKPLYPPDAKEARIQGTVRLDAIIGKDGTMVDLRAASGHPLLVPAALEAVRQWVYKPTLLNGNPVEVVTVIDINFTLSQ
jgi:protein TonB